MVGERKLYDVCQVYKCGGVPMYPTEHSIFKKRISGQSDKYVKNREKRVVDFLNRHGFDLTVDDD